MALTEPSLQEGAHGGAASHALLSMPPSLQGRDALASGQGKDLGRWCLKDHCDGVKGKHQERCSDPAASLHPSERAGASTVPVLIL